MGFMDEFKKWARLDVDDEDDDDFEEMVNAKPEREQEAPIIEKRNNKVVNIHTTTQLQVVLVKPERYEISPEIADHLKERRTVVLNLENADAAQSRRIVDFLSGAAYALSYKFKPVSNSTFVIVPDNTDFSGDLIFDDFGSENYFI